MPTVTSADGRWAVLAEPAPARAAGAIGPARTSSHFAVTNGAGWVKEVTLRGNFSPEAFGFIEGHPMTLQMIEYLPPEHPKSYRVRTLDLTTGAVGLPVNLRDKATPVDETMAGTSRTQVYASGEDLLFTLYQPVSTDGGAWEYGFVHTLATAWGGVWCIDLPDVLGLEDHRGTLAISPDHQLLYVATGAGRIGTIRTSDVQALEVDRTASLGVAADDQPVMAAGSDRLWVGLGRRLLVVDPISLEVVARAELPAAVTALTLDPATHSWSAPTREAACGGGQWTRPVSSPRPPPQPSPPASGPSPASCCSPPPARTTLPLARPRPRRSPAPARGHPRPPAPTPARWLAGSPAGRPRPVGAASARPAAARRPDRPLRRR